MTRRDSLGQMSHSDLISLVLEQERIFEEAARQWKAEVVRYREALELAEHRADLAEKEREEARDIAETAVRSKLEAEAELAIARAALGDQ